MSYDTAPTIDPTHLRALEARQRVIEVRPKRAAKPQLPPELVQDPTVCITLYENAISWYEAAIRAYEVDDDVTGDYCVAFGDAYLASAQACEQNSTPFR